MNQHAKRDELRALQEQVRVLESELGTGAAEGSEWPPRSYYTTYHILAGMTLGMIGAAASLLFNVIGATLVGRHPLDIIRVYLTLPLGEKALTLNDGVTLGIGSCLYLCIGIIGGIPFHLILSRFFEGASTARRFLVATALAIGVWLVNLYGIVSWLQPLLCDGQAWILETIPVYVAVSTHLVYGWTLLLVDQWGRFEPPLLAGESVQPTTKAFDPR